MNDLETYTRWLLSASAYEKLYMRGEITNDEYDQRMRNMEERLGVNTWSVVRWHRAQNDWYKAKAGEGA